MNVQTLAPKIHENAAKLKNRILILAYLFWYMLKDMLEGPMSTVKAFYAWNSFEKKIDVLQKHNLWIHFWNS